MCRIPTRAFCGVLAVVNSFLLHAAEKPTYPTPPEAIRHEGVPQGQLIQGTFRDSRIYPGTERDYWVYLPAQLDAEKPAPLMVFQDGKGYCNDARGARAHIVFDNLIHEGALPPLVGLFINPGVVPAANEDALPRFNRSFEYVDGSLRYKQPYFHLHLPPTGTETHADGMCTSAEGWLLSATESGIQICDQPGRVNLILPKPGHGRRVCYLRLHKNTLYAATADAVWKRPVKITAAKPFEKPVAPTKPNL